MKRVSSLILSVVALVAVGCGPGDAPLESQQAAQRSGEVITVSKCYTNATATSFGELLIKAQSTNTGAQLLAYRPDGSLIGSVQNGGGGKYGGTVMPVQPSDPVHVTLKSSTGGTVTVPTTPFQL